MSEIDPLLGDTWVRELSLDISFDNLQTFYRGFGDGSVRFRERELPHARAVGRAVGERIAKLHIDPDDEPLSKLQDELFDTRAVETGKIVGSWAQKRVQAIFDARNRLGGTTLRRWAHNPRDADLAEAFGANAANDAAYEADASLAVWRTLEGRRIKGTARGLSLTAKLSEVATSKSLRLMEEERRFLC